MRTSPTREFSPGSKVVVPGPGEPRRSQAPFWGLNRGQAWGLDDHHRDNLLIFGGCGEDSPQTLNLMNE
jgi:hypothetical protein